MSIANLIIDPQRAFRQYQVILEAKIRITGPAQNMTSEKIGLVVHAFSNVLIYSRAFEKLTQDGFESQIKQVASQTEKIYQHIKNTTGLEAVAL